jgi:LysR family transcriptional regulator for metE and metH
MNFIHGSVMILEIRHLRLVSAVAEHGSLTRAGRVLHLTQSALSHQLLDLEDRLRTALFHRMGKRMVPTVAGLRLLDAARQTLPVLSDAEEDLGRLASGRESVLRLSTECYTCYHWLPACGASGAFSQVDVRVVAVCRPVPALLDGQIGLGIVHHGRDDRLDHPPLPRRALRE